MTRGILVGGELGGLDFPVQQISQDGVSLGIMELGAFELDLK